MEEVLEGADREVAPVRVAEDVELPLDKAEHMVELDRDHAVRREDPGDGGDEGVRVISVRQRVTCDDDASPACPPPREPRRPPDRTATWRSTGRSRDRGPAGD